MDHKNENQLPDVTQVMPAVKFDKSDAKHYSVKNTCKKRIFNTNKTPSNNQMPEVIDTRSNSADPRAKKTAVSNVPNEPHREANFSNSVKKHESENSSTKEKVIDPNKRYMLAGIALIALSVVIFVAVIAVGFQHFYKQGIDTGKDYSSIPMTSQFSDSFNSNSNSKEDQNSKKIETPKTEEAPIIEDSTTTEVSDGDASLSSPSGMDQSTCLHQWTDITTTVHHDAKTHDVQHEAEYKTVTNYYTVCNVCGEKIDNKIEEHKKEKGHYSWTTGVPFEELEKSKDAWTETIIDSQAWDEEVVVGRRCSVCELVQMY